MGNKNMVKDWYQLDRKLVITSATTIEEEIRKAEVALFNLREEQRNGVTEKRHETIMRSIEGIPIKHQGATKISLATSRAHNRKKYDSELSIVRRWLKQQGFKMVESCRTVNTEKGGCDKRWIKIK
jgi:hypothetical protein